MPRRSAGDQYSSDTGNVWRSSSTLQLSSVRACLARGIDVNIRNKVGWTPIHAASSSSATSPSAVTAMLDFLRRSGASLFEKDDSERTVLHTAASFVNVPAIKWLLKKESGTFKELINQADSKGLTPLDVAKGQELREILEKAGAKRGCPSSVGVPPSSQDEAHASSLPGEGKPAWEGRRAHGARRRPFSGKEKKAQLQAKRAAKRGGEHLNTSTNQSTDDEDRRLISSFGEVHDAAQKSYGLHTLISKESTNDLESRRADADRPLEGCALEAANFAELPSYPHQWLASERGGAAPFSLPPQPAFDVPASPERDAAEAATIENWASTLGERVKQSSAPFERNPRVWRQLWLLLNRADVVVCCTPCALALLHMPEPVLEPLAQRGVPVIIALTKADHLTASVREKWAAELARRYPNVHAVVPVSADGRAANVAVRGSRARWLGRADDGVQALWDILMDTHVSPRDLDENISLGDLLDRGAAEDSAARAKGGSIKHVPEPGKDDEEALGSEEETDGDDEADDDDDDDDDDDKDQIDNSTTPNSSSVSTSSDIRWKSAAAWRTARRRGDKSGARASRSYAAIGFVGEPNCGKSALVNRLLGASVAGVSTTPGRTQRLQTHFLTPYVALLDCPGLVFPKESVTRALAVVVGNLPVAQCREPYSAVRVLCHWVGLDTIRREFGLPDDARLPRRNGGSGVGCGGGDDDDDEDHNRTPSPYRLCEQIAVVNNFFTPKAARPDAARAANFLLRIVLRGSPIRVVFGPPALNDDTD